MDKGYLKISKLTFRKAYRSDKYMNGLILAIAIKANHKNSIIYNISTKKIRTLLRCNLAKAKECLQDGLDCGLLKYIQGKDGKQHLLATHLFNKKGKIFKISVLKYEYGARLYLESKRINSAEYNKKIKKHQSYKDIRDLFYAIGLLQHEQGYTKMLNTFIVKKKQKELNIGSESISKKMKKQIMIRGVKGIRDYAKQMMRKGKICVFNGGYSYASMMRIFHNKLTVKKIGQLQRWLNDQKLVRVYKNVIMYREIFQSTNDFKEKFYVDEDGKDKYFRTYWKGGELCDNDYERGLIDIRLMRLANSYEYTSNAITRGRDFKTIAIAIRNKEIKKQLKKAV